MRVGTYFLLIALSTLPLLPKSASAIVVDGQDSMGFWDVQGAPDYLFVESLEAGLSGPWLYNLARGFLVSFQPGVDQNARTTPVEFNIHQLSVRYWIPFDQRPNLNFSFPTGSYINYLSLFYNYYTRTGPVRSITVHARSTGDTVSIAPYYGSGVVTTSLDDTLVTISAPEGEILSPSNGTEYLPVGNLPTFTFSDHDFDMWIAINYPGPIWKEKLYGDFLLTRVANGPNLGIPGIQAIGMTADTIREGFLMDLSDFTLPTLTSFVTLPMFYSLAELEEAGVIWQSLRLYRHNDIEGKWVLAGEDSNSIQGSGVFVQGTPTMNIGDYGVYKMEEEGLVLVWANIDVPGEYSVGGEMEPFLQHAIQILQLLCKMSPPLPENISDTDGDSKLGLSEVIDLLNKATQ